jgi:uncharacterized protein (TIGR00290 family)
MLALDRAVRAGLPVKRLFNLFDAESGRVPFHGVRAEMIQRQARELGLELLQLGVPPGAYEERFLYGLDRLREAGVDSIIFGNIHLGDVRAWYEERTRGRGFEHVEPLWSEDPAALVREFLDRGYRTIIASADLERGRREWVGQELTRALADEIGAAEGVDAAGERGEYHTFVFAGPVFASSIHVHVGEIVEHKGHVLVDLTEAPPPF